MGRSRRSRTARSSSSPRCFRLLEVAHAQHSHGDASRIRDDAPTDTRYVASADRVTVSIQRCARTTMPSRTISACCGGRRTARRASPNYPRLRQITYPFSAIARHSGTSVAIGFEPASSSTRLRSSSCTGLERADRTNVSAVRPLPRMDTRVLAIRYVRSSSIPRLGRGSPCGGGSRKASRFATSYRFAMGENRAPAGAPRK